MIQLNDEVMQDDDHGISKDGVDRFSRVDGSSIGLLGNREGESALQIDTKDGKSS